MSKNKLSPTGIVYSTDPGYAAQYEYDETLKTVENDLQRLVIKMETKQRAGKAVTVVRGFTGKNNDLEILGKKLKVACGTGGSVKDGEILIQGDNREKVFQWLIKNGFKKSKKI